MAASIIIPDALAKHLKDKNSNNQWLRRIEGLLDRLNPILSQSPTFFPEYTDHGILHINTVLDFADNLIHSKSRHKKVLTPQDVACLTAAILIHDLGMFLSPSGVAMLMEPEWDSHRISRLDEKSWKTVWDEYISSAKLLPNAQKLRSFGKVLRVEHTYPTKTPLIRDDILVIGEFLRQNHPRLAHEIAVGGLPGHEVQDLLQDFSEDERNAIGLMARSHGMALRELESYLGTGTHYCNMPVYYLMSVLRLADLLDVSEHRAPMVRLKQEALDSPLSQDEWILNQRFRIDSSRWFKDARNYVITANPKTSSEYVRVEKWLNNAQAELDLCWSILAEKYPDSKLKLSIHRILCTMHEPANHDAISGKILPRELKVTASPEIVKLMIAPLYGNDPTYGVRELLQNAVDACLERQRWENEHGNPDYEGLVDIRIDGNTFTITDNGMGMNEDILLNYYLTAGASYRGSEQWKAANAPDGKSQVSRTGRFGVGFLAAFLLGDSIEVHTHHYADAKGLHFTFDQRSMPLDVERQKRRNPYRSDDPIGTTITIQMTDGVRKKLDEDDVIPWYNWYAFDKPSVEYHMDGEQLYHEDLSLSRDPARNEGWFSLPSDIYDSYQWAPNDWIWGPEFYCNGIRIYGNMPIEPQEYGFLVAEPYISIVDNNGKLDVDLSRRELQSVPHEAALCREVFRYHIARLLLKSWDSEGSYHQNLKIGFLHSRSSATRQSPFLLSSGGYQLNHKSVISALSIREYVLLYSEASDTRNAVQGVPDFLHRNIPFSMAVAARGAPMFFDMSYRFDSPEEFFDTFINRYCIGSNKQCLPYQGSYASIWLRDNVLQSISESSQEALQLQSTSASDRICTAFYRGKYSNMPIHREQFPIDTFPIAIHIDEGFPGEFSQVNLFTQTLKETLIPAEGYDPNDLWIPFDMEERKRKFRKAFEELAPYIDYIRTKRAQGDRDI